MTKLKRLTTYIDESDILYQSVMAEAHDTGLSIADILRLALKERQERKLAEVYARLKARETEDG